MGHGGTMDQETSFETWFSTRQSCEQYCNTKHESIFHTVQFSMIKLNMSKLIDI